MYNTVDGETRLGVLYERHNEPEALSLPDVVYISYHKPAINAKGYYYPQCPAMHDSDTDDVQQPTLIHSTLGYHSPRISAYEFH